MLGIERRQAILNRLLEKRKVHVSDLSEEFGVTAETVRRDLERLEKEGRVRRSYGGAVLARPSNEDLPFNSRKANNTGEKEAIAVKALGLVNSGATLMCDSSTTVLSLVELLTGKNDLTLITTSVKILHDFANSRLNLVATGGTLRGRSFSLTGEGARRTLEAHNVDIAVMGCKGLDIDKGIMESNEPEAVLKKIMASQSKTRILLADHSKFDQVVYRKALDFSDIDCLVTDREPERAWSEFCRARGIQLIY
ncbi:MAG: DeoR/GlpR family DNA-binding transcription regulator [Deltaproteobacteria bacterium]|jgi:DeoR/GlpR family transcriptional regulator of sugar metabolism|nr:DeoR/GlpR family DNA-binding transcription regulator [Deltaproteobacteria bacterium]